MTINKLPDLTGQWIDLVPLVGPVQLPLRPQQMIDSYVTIWQKGDRLWAGDGFGTVTADGVVTMYDQQAQYKNGEIVWPGDHGLNAYIRTVDLAGVWQDQYQQLHTLAQRNSPVEPTEMESVLGAKVVGTLTGHTLSCVHKETQAVKTATISRDGYILHWSDGDIWQRHLHLQGDWISIKNKAREVIHCRNLEVSIGGVPGTIDPAIWYVNAKDKPFPDNKTKGGIDLDSTAIHWSDYIGWQRVFALEGRWLNTAGDQHEVSQQRIQNPTEYRRFTWNFDTALGTGTLIRNWVEIRTGDQTMQGQLDYDSQRIHWSNGDIWRKEDASNATQ